MTNIPEPWEIFRENEQKRHNRHIRVGWLAGSFLREKVEAYHTLNPSDTTFIYAGQVLQEKVKEEAIIGVVRNHPSFYHPGFCSDIHFLAERYDLGMVISSMLSCFAPHFERIHLFPYVGDIVGADNEIKIVPMPKLRKAIQRLMEPYERNLASYLTEEIRKERHSN